MIKAALILYLVNVYTQLLIPTEGQQILIQIRTSVGITDKDFGSKLSVTVCIIPKKKHWFLTLTGWMSHICDTQLLVTETVVTIRDTQFRLQRLRLLPTAATVSTAFIEVSSKHTEYMWIFGVHLQWRRCRWKRWLLVLRCYEQHTILLFQMTNAKSSYSSNVGTQRYTCYSITLLEKIIHPNELNHAHMPRPR